MRDAVAVISGAVPLATRSCAPILISDTSHIERWRWENDPFGLTDPIEYTVTGSDVNPDDTSGNPYATCCCSAGGCGAGCNQCTSGCSAGQCTGGGNQDVVWSKTYSPNAGSGRTVKSVRVHFSSFDVKAGSSRTAKDYVKIFKSDGSTVPCADASACIFTGNLGDFWSPWSNDTGIAVKLTADYAADGTAGFVIDKLEYTTDVSSGTSEQYVLIERFPDPIGLRGGEPGYFGYANSSPIIATDANGLGGVESRALAVR